MFMSQGNYEAVRAPSSLMHQHLAAMMDVASDQAAAAAAAGRAPLYETGLRAIYNPREESVRQQVHKQISPSSAPTHRPPMSAQLRQQSHPNFHFGQGQSPQKVQVRRKDFPSNYSFPISLTRRKKSDSGGYLNERARALLFSDPHQR